MLNSTLYLRSLSYSPPVCVPISHGAFSKFLCIPYPNIVCYMLHPCRLLWLDVGDNNLVNNFKCPHGLRRGFAASRLLWLRVRIPPVAWRFVSCDCFVLSGRGLCEELPTRPEKFYRVWWGATVIVYTYDD